MSNQPVLAKLFAEHAAPQHASKQATYEQLTPVFTVVAALKKQMIEYKALLMAEQLSVQDGSLDGKFEHIHQTLSAIEREVDATGVAVRAVVTAMSQLDRYMAETKADIERLAAGKHLGPGRVPNEIAT